MARHGRGRKMEKARNSKLAWRGLCANLNLIVGG